MTSRDVESWRHKTDDGVRLHVEVLQGGATGADAGTARTDDGVRLHVEVSRGGATPPALPVLLLNGLTMATSGWDGLTERLQHDQERTVIRYDMRGQGQSGAPSGPYTRERHARDLTGVLADLAGRGYGRVHVVGLSNGAYVAQLALAWALAAEGGGSPQLDHAGHCAPLEPPPLTAFASLVLLDTFAKADPRLVAVVNSWLVSLALGGATARFDTATPWIWGPDFLAANQRALADARTSAGSQPQDAVRGLLEGLLVSARREPDLSGVLRTATLPLLVAHGEDDVLTTARNHRELLAQFGREDDTARLIPGAGHAAPIERPDAAAALIMPFLRDADALASGKG